MADGCVEKWDLNSHMQRQNLANRRCFGHTAMVIFPYGAMVMPPFTGKCNDHDKDSHYGMDCQNPYIVLLVLRSLFSCYITMIVA
jgi:hypothetical protein